MSLAYIKIFLLDIIFHLINLWQGEVLFQTRENLEHLAMMEKVLGPFPEYLLRKAEYASVFETLLSCVADN